MALDDTKDKLPFVKERRNRLSLVQLRLQRDISRVRPRDIIDDPRRLA